MSPRDLAVAFLAGAALALGVLGSASAGTQATPKYGGTLVVGLRGDADTLDPTLTGVPAVTGQIFSVMCLPLYETNSKMESVPVLAAALPAISKDKLTYTVQLRQGVRFNDGTPFNAQAVVTTVQRYMTYPGSVRKIDFVRVESVIATGPYTVVYRLRARDSTFNGDARVLSPAQLTKTGANFGADPVCVGPFMFDHRVVGDHVTVIKSPYYFDQKDVYLDKIVFKAMPDAVAAAAALKAGDIQVLDNPLSTEREAMQTNSSLRVIKGYNRGWSGIQINLGNRNGAGNPPYAKDVGTPLSQSAKLRQAFEEAIDRNLLNELLFDGLAQVTCTPIGPADTLWYEATKVPCTPYNPKHAKKLVAESGFSNPTVRLLVTNSPDNVLRAQFIQSQEAAVGINVVIDAVSIATNGARRSDGDFDAVLSGFTPGGIDPTTAIRLATSDTANYSGYSNPRLDLILGNGLKATSIQARSTLYRVAQQIILNDRPYIALYNSSVLAAFSANVTGVQLTVNGQLTVANARYR